MNELSFFFPLPSFQTKLLREKGGFLVFILRALCEELKMARIDYIYAMQSHTCHVSLALFLAISSLRTAGQRSWHQKKALLEHAGVVILDYYDGDPPHGIKLVHKLSRTYEPW